MDKRIEIFPSPFELARKFAEKMSALVMESAKGSKPYTIALSGGSTPEILFSVLSEYYSKVIPWKYVHFFWGDERCVPPDDPESNYGMTARTLFSNIEIPPRNIHRIIGEADPVNEAIRYSEEIALFTRKRGEIPVFDLMLLGLGEDGHTASIFPGHSDLLVSGKTCEVAIHPSTHQKRITLTGKVINNADEIAFLVTGTKKSEVVERIFKKDPMALNYPASSIVPVYGRLSWFLDKEAGSLL